MEDAVDAHSSSSETAWENSYVHLSAHPIARNQAVAARLIPAGASIFSESALSMVLLPEQKGLRCDACLRLSGPIKRCSGCVVYWYCGIDCQTRHWKTVHKHMCKNIASLSARSTSQTYSVRGETDGFLLSHLVAEHGHKLSCCCEGLPSEDLNDPMKTFTSLLAHSIDSREKVPFICSNNRTISVRSDVLRSLWSRFGNNNFTIHSHLNPVGHGIFPLASRLFNHSCIPNAIVTYVFNPEGVRLVVKTLTKIYSGNEITIPYFDPALPLQRRQEICRHSYGFECACPACTFYKSLGNIPKPPTDSTQRLKTEDWLVEYAFPGRNLDWPSEPKLFALPIKLSVILNGNFLPGLSKTFRDASHDGYYALALRNGLVLLALYVVLYPPHYPQIGIHCLEVAKTAWNASVQERSIDGYDEDSLLKTAREFLLLALDSLSVLGKEGDEDEGPLIECSTLSSLLNSTP